MSLEAPREGDYLGNDPINPFFGIRGYPAPIILWFRHRYKFLAVFDGKKESLPPLEILGLDLRLPFPRKQLDLLLWFRAPMGPLSIPVISSSWYLKGIILFTTGVTIPPLEDVTRMALPQPLPPRRRALRPDPEYLHRLRCERTRQRRGGRSGRRFPCSLLARQLGRIAMWITI
jgi:hypothetical protein